MIQFANRWLFAARKTQTCSVSTRAKNYEFVASPGFLHIVPVNEGGALPPVNPVPVGAVLPTPGQIVQPLPVVPPGIVGNLTPPGAQIGEEIMSYHDLHNIYLGPDSLNRLVDGIANFSVDIIDVMNHGHFQDLRYRLAPLIPRIRRLRDAMLGIRDDYSAEHGIPFSEEGNVLVASGYRLNVREPIPSAQEFQYSEPSGSIGVGEGGEGAVVDSVGIPSVLEEFSSLYHYFSGLLSIFNFFQEIFSYFLMIPGISHIMFLFSVYRTCCRIYSMTCTEICVQVNQRLVS